MSAITVKGQSVSNRAAYEIIEKELARSILAYKLPEYRAALGL